MAWTAGVTRSTGDLISAADWNNYLGASGSLDYLKTETDKLDDLGYTHGGKSLDTEYQNTSGCIQVACLTASMVSGENVQWKMNSFSPPTTVIAAIANSTGTQTLALAMTILIPPNYYHNAVSSGSPSLTEYTLYDLH